MLCKLCKAPHKNKAFCSHACRNEWIRLNNLTNNPIHNPINREKMRKAQIGKRHSQKTKQKMSIKRKMFLEQNPKEKDRMVKNIWDKYTSKIAGTAWAKISKKIRERDNYTCQNCYATDRRLVVHHKDWKGKRRGLSETLMNNDPSNLITLCLKCHNAIHRHKSNDYRQRYKQMTGLDYGNTNPK